MTKSILLDYVLCNTVFILYLFRNAILKLKHPEFEKKKLNILNESTMCPLGQQLCSTAFHANMKKALKHLTGELCTALTKERSTAKSLINPCGADDAEGLLNERPGKEITALPLSNNLQNQRCSCRYADFISQLQN